jgi:hypothetical protein
LNSGPATHDPEKLVLDMIGDGNRFSEKIMRPEKSPQDNINSI